MTNLGAAVNALITILIKVTEDLVLLLVDSEITLETPVILFTVVSGIGQTAFDLDIHVVHMVWSQERVVDQLKTLPTVTRLAIRIGIGPDFCGVKKSF